MKTQLLLFAVLILTGSALRGAKIAQKSEDVKTGLAALSGDCRGDRVANNINFRVLSNSSGQSSGQSGYSLGCDFNGDNTANILDFQMRSNSFGKTPSSGTPTPPTISAAPQNTYYVSKSGSDSNNGSLNSPWLTIQKAVDTMTPGDLTYIRAGIYAESVNITSSGNATQGNINLLAYPGEIPTLDGGSNIALQSSAATNYWNVQGLILQSTNRYTVQIGWWGDPNNTHWTFSNNRIHGSLLIKGSNNLISSNDVSGIYPDGTQYGSYPGQDQGDAGIMDIDGSNHNIIRANNVHDFSNVDGRGIWTQGFTHDDLIENNVVTNIVPTGGIGQSIDLDGAATVEWNHTVRGNKITGNNYVGIQLENVFNSLVENNVVRDTGAAGIILINYDSTIGCATAGTSGSPYGDTNGNGSCKDELSSDVIRQNLIIASTGWEYGGIINWGVRQPSVLGNSVYSLADAGNAEINYPDIAPGSEQSFLKTIVTSFLTVWRGIFNK